jgi:hypothetical protein
VQQPPGYPPGPPGPAGYGYPPAPGYPPAGGAQYPYGSPGAPPMGGGGAAPPPKKGMSVAAIVLIILVVLIAVFGGGCLVCVCVVGKSDNDAKEKSDLDRKNAKNIRLDDLLSAYKTNEVRADTTYKDRYYRVNGGEVDDVRKGISDQMYVTIGTGRLIEIPMVQCMLRSDQTSRASSLSKGRRINVRGKVTGLLLNVILTDCEIL